jgi:hypothetical protein
MDEGNFLDIEDGKSQEKEREKRKERRRDVHMHT